MVYYTQSDRQNKLYLGKQVGNVLVFKYSVVFTIEVADNEAPNYMNLAAEDRDGTKYYTLTIGSNYVQQVVQGGMGMTKTLDFSKLNDKVLERIFQEVIKSNRTDYLYINSLLLSGAYANYMLG
jgi:hypothetical protein